MALFSIQKDNKSNENSFMHYYFCPQIENKNYDLMKLQKTVNQMPGLTNNPTIKSNHQNRSAFNALTKF